MNEFQEDKSKFAIIHYDKNSYFARLMQESGFTVVSAYRETNLMQRVIRKIHLKLKFPKKEIWFNKKHNLKDFESLIIFDAAINYDLINFFKKSYPSKRLILWYWNPVRNSIDPNSLSSDVCEKWSYSIEDCKKHNLKYNTTFYFHNLVNLSEVKNLPFEKNDIFFVGRDKSRLSLLLEYKVKFESLGLKTYFHITPTRWYEKWKNKNYKNDISYNQIIKYINDSKSILDIVQNQSDGLTLRAMESVFFNKKLITNNKIIKHYDFYCKENIFILGEDNLSYLNEFLNTSYKELDSKIVQNYGFESWLKRFI